MNSLPFQKSVGSWIAGAVKDSFHVVVGVIRHLPNKDTLVNIAASVRGSALSREILERAAQTYCSPKTTTELSSVPLLLRSIGPRLSVRMFHRLCLPIFPDLCAREEVDCWSAPLSGVNGVREKSEEKKLMYSSSGIRGLKRISEVRDKLRIEGNWILIFSFYGRVSVLFILWEYGYRCKFCDTWRK